MIDLIKDWANQNSGSFLAIVVIAVTSVVQISPIKINPWTWVVQKISRLFQSEVLKELESVKKELAKVKQELDNHASSDDDRDADTHRRVILAFNKELIRKLPHTREDFVDILEDINFYEAYCEDHPHYKNNRATHAIANIKRVYDERLEKCDFELD